MLCAGCGHLCVPYATVDGRKKSPASRTRSPACTLLPGRISQKIACGAGNRKRRTNRSLPRALSLRRHTALARKQDPVCEASSTMVAVFISWAHSCAAWRRTCLQVRDQIQGSYKECRHAHRNITRIIPTDRSESPLDEHDGDKCGD